MKTTEDKYGWYVGDDIKYHHGPTERKFTHTPNWPYASDPTQEQPCQTVTISVRMRCYGRGITRKEAESLCVRFEKLATARLRRKDMPEVSARV
jgi:hypothetical protein